MQIFFTDARTFISTPSFPALLVRLLIAIHNPPAGQIVRRKLHRHAVTGKNANEILPHLSGDVGQHLVLFSSSTRNMAFGSGSITVAITSMASSFPLSPGFLLFSLIGPLAMRSCQFESCYQTGPAASRGRVKIQGPFAVTATVCSKCAESLPSVVTAVQSSASIFTPGPPRFTIGSIARTILPANAGPVPECRNSESAAPRASAFQSVPDEFANDRKTVLFDPLLYGC